MINATTAKENVKKYYEKNEARKKDLTLTAMERDLAPVVRKASEQGRVYVTCRVPAAADRGYLSAYLEKEGFEIEYSGDNITISWENVRG